MSFIINGSARRSRSICLLFVFCLGLLNLIPVWGVAFPPLQDYPNHLARAKIISDYENPELDYKENFQPVSYPLPNSLADGILVVLLKFFSPYVSGKIFISICIIIFSLGVFYFLNYLNPQNIYLSLLAPLFSYNLFLYMGFLNYYLSIPIFFICLTFYFKYINTLKSRYLLALVAGSYFLYLAHLSSVVLFIFSIYLLCLLRFRDRRKGVLGVAVVSPIIVLPLVIYGLYVMQNIEHREVVSGDLLKIFHLDLSRKPHFFLVVFKGYADAWGGIVRKFVLGLLVVLGFMSIRGRVSTAEWGYVVISGTVLYACYEFVNAGLGVVLSLLGFIIAGYFMIFKRPVFKLPHNSELLFLWAALWVIYLFLPFESSTLGGWWVDSRVVPYLVLLPLAFLTCAKGAFKKGVLAVLILINIVSPGLNYSAFAQESRILEQDYNALQYIPKNKRVLPVMCGNWIEAPNSTDYFWAYYHIDKGGVSPFLFAHKFQQPLSYKVSPDPLDMFWCIRHEPRDFMKMKSRYDYYLVFNKDEVFEQVLDHEEHIVTKGNLSIYKNGAWTSGLGDESNR